MPGVVVLDPGRGPGRYPGGEVLHRAELEPLGPRYDETMTDEDRRAFDNLADRLDEAAGDADAVKMRPDDEGNASGLIV